MLGGNGTGILTNHQHNIPVDGDFIFFPAGVGAHMQIVITYMTKQQHTYIGVFLLQTLIQICGKNTYICNGQADILIGHRAQHFEQLANAISDLPEFFRILMGLGNQGIRNKPGFKLGKQRRLKSFCARHRVIIFVLNQ